MPLIEELPAPAEPADGTSCADALPDTIRPTSTAKRTSAEWPDMASPGKLRTQRSCGEPVPGLKLAPRYFPE